MGNDFPLNVDCRLELPQKDLIISIIIDWNNPLDGLSCDKNLHEPHILNKLQEIVLIVEDPEITIS